MEVELSRQFSSNPIYSLPERFNLLNLSEDNVLALLDKDLLIIAVTPAVLAKLWNSLLTTQFFQDPRLVLAAPDLATNAYIEPQIQPPYDLGQKTLVDSKSLISPCCFTSLSNPISRRSVP